MKVNRKKTIQRTIHLPQLKYPLNFSKHLEIRKSIVNQKTSTLHHWLMKFNKSKKELVEWMFEIQKPKKSEVVLSSKQLKQVKCWKEENPKRSKSVISATKKEEERRVSEYTELEKLQMRLKDNEWLKKCRVKLSDSSLRCNRSCEERNDTFGNIKRGKYHSSFGKPIFVRINPFDKDEYK